MRIDLSKSIPLGAHHLIISSSSVLDGMTASQRIQGWNGLGITGPVDDPVLSVQVQPDFPTRWETVKLQVKYLSKELLGVWEVMSL